MIINFNGPNHYINGKDKAIGSNIYARRIYKNYHKHFVDIPFQNFETLIKEKTAYDVTYSEKYLKQLIDEELSAVAKQQSTNWVSHVN